jgi:hypothetical protein
MQPHDPPAWLDLDMIVPTELRFRMRGLAGRLEELAPLLAELAAESVEVRDAYEAAIDQADANEILEQLNALSGWDSVFEAWMLLIGTGCDVTESVPI